MKSSFNPQYRVNVLATRTSQRLHRRTISFQSPISGQCSCNYCSQSLTFLCFLAFNPQYRVNVLATKNSESDRQRLTAFNPQYRVNVLATLEAYVFEPNFDFFQSPISGQCSCNFKSCYFNCCFFNLSIPNIGSMFLQLVF